MAAHDVFISYPSADKVAADGVCHGLEARGVRCWMAPRDVIPGTDWQTSLLDAISDARVVVLLFTGNTNGSEHIKREVTAAFEGGSVVIPFRLENVAPQGALRYHLTGVHWLDAFSQPIDQHVEQLASTIKRVLEKPLAGAAVVEVPSGAAALVEPRPEPTPSPVPISPTPTPTPVASTMRPLPPQTATPKPVAPAPTPRPVPTPARPAAARKGGISPWLIMGGGLLAVILVVVVLASMGGDGQTAPADPATADAEALRQQGVQIGVESRPEPVAGETTPVPTLDTPPEAPPVVDAPVYEEPPVYEEQPVYEEPAVVEEGPPKF